MGMRPMPYSGKLYGKEWGKPLPLNSNIPDNSHPRHRSRKQDNWEKDKIEKETPPPQSKWRKRNETQAQAPQLCREREEYRKIKLPGD
ncbi:hypothetical protein CDAR_22691 [Caerostris darwini]|uniref:Uncharacterized protein n=1 Tax=Caerostris darwini TaxID=1538125 RepID=A0AAV4S3P2_9ARAC|nr:hypothetical protein CDAR_22691 [Caerostris darwini]